MGSRSKKKTTFAKLARESKLRERRLEKQAKKEARKRAGAAPPTQLGDALAGDQGFGDTHAGDERLGDARERLGDVG